MTETLSIPDSITAQKPAPPLSKMAAFLIDRAGFASMLGIGQSTFDRLRACGKIGPQPVRLSGVKWPLDEIEAWLGARGPDGELFNAANWSAVWKSLKARPHGK